VNRPSREEYALVLALSAATRSEDPYVKVGACLMRGDGTIAALGYNGAPPGVEIDWSDRDARRHRVIHAESNALRYVRPGEAVLMATTLMPCLECLKLAAAYGIKDIVYLDDVPDHYDPDLVRAVASEFRVDMRRAR
jgi:dCMP deaminase